MLKERRRTPHQSSFRTWTPYFAIVLIVLGFILTGVISPQSASGSTRGPPPTPPSIPPGVAIWPQELNQNATITLPSGHELPLMGFGLAALGGESNRVIRKAMQSGFRLFDTAAEKAPWYQNERTLGTIMHDPSAFPPGTSLNDMFLTTKLYPADLGYEKTVIAIKDSLENLRVPAIDLFLIHFPFCHGQPNVPRECGRWQGSWKAMEEAHAAGTLRNIGVSNFDLMQLNELHNLAKVPIAVVQTWADPWHQSRDIRTWCATHNVVFQAYSLLGTQWEARNPALRGNGPIARSARLQALGKALGVAPQLVVLRWALQSKIAVIPRSSRDAHIAGLMGVWNITLDSDDMQEVDSLDRVDPMRGL